MERLTERIGNSVAYSEFNSNNSDGCYEMMDNCLHKLAEYEDAEEQGLLLKLPCKVGTPYWTFDTQYWIDESKCECCKHYKGYDVMSFCDCDVEYPECTQIIEKVFSSNNEIVFYMVQLGKTVFLTKEEAEQALKQMGE